MIFSLTNELQSIKDECEELQERLVQEVFSKILPTQLDHHLDIIILSSVIFIDTIVRILHDDLKFNIKVIILEYLSLYTWVFVIWIGQVGNKSGLYRCTPYSSYFRWKKNRQWKLRMSGLWKSYKWR